MAAKFAIVAPYRDALSALTATMLDPRHELGVTNPLTEVIRRRVLGVFAAVVCGASDAPASGAEPLIRGLYGLHLGLMFLWCQDRTPDGNIAGGALAMACELLGFAAPLASLPEAAGALERIDGVFRPLLFSEDDAEVQRLAREILLRLFRHRRLAAAGPCGESPCQQCLAHHLPRVIDFLRAGRPLHFLLPAFPAKSPSRRKTLGPLPDRAEELALRYLEDLCGELRELHAPGARITICSDGHVFSDLVCVSDQEVSEYGRELQKLLAALDCHSLDTFNMADLYEMSEFAEMRESLDAHYALPLSPLNERLSLFEHVGALVNGIHRFLFEEQAELQPERSRTKVRNECRERAYEVVRRSDAWGRLLADCFPTALRLSIHPQHPHGEKIGILLGAADDAWLTPWHAAALSTPAGWRFAKVAEAEALGARLVQHAGRPSHFVLEDSSSRDAP